MQGFGAKNLQTISNDVMRWNRWGHNLPQMEAIAEQSADQASTLAYGAIDAIFPEDGELVNLENRIEELDDSQRFEIVRAYLAKMAVGKLRGMKNGTGFGYGKRARLSINESGVTRKRAFIEPGHNIDIRGRRRIVEPGTLIEGKIASFSSHPEVGGRLMLNHALGTSIVYGLVNPSNGRPRVDLDILARS